MKKEIYGHEISVLRDTFRRLLRRHAKPNLIKLVQKTHPADIAVLFRYFNEEEQFTLFEYVQEHSEIAEFLRELDESIVQQLFSFKTPEEVVSLFQKLNSNDQAYVLGLLNEDQSQEILERLKAEEIEVVEEFMSYPEDSAGSLMYTDVFTLHEETTAKDAIVMLQDHREARWYFIYMSLMTTNTW